MSSLDFLLKMPVCNNGSLDATDCISSNQREELLKMQTQINTNQEKYQNISMKYNLEMWNSINLCGGIGLLLLYVYYNK